MSDGDFIAQSVVVGKVAQLTKDKRQAVNLVTEAELALRISHRMGTQSVSKLFPEQSKRTTRGYSVADAERILAYIADKCV